MSKVADEARKMQEVTEAVADQSVYVYKGDVMVAHMPSSTRWELRERPDGMACECWCWSESRGRFEAVKTFEPGEWTFCGRGHPGL
jgi:hypothetical protein